MPLYVNDENEVLAEDDRPLPANTPGTGSLSTTRVIECGNRVLELIEKHKQEIQTRMAKRGNSFRGMLERELENRNKRLERSHSASRGQASPEIYSTQNVRAKKEGDEPVRFGNYYKKDDDHPNLGVMSSEEYFEPPGSSSAHPGNQPVSSKSGKPSILQSPNSSVNDKVNPVAGKKGSILKQYTSSLINNPTTTTTRSNSLPPFQKLLSGHLPSASSTPPPPPVPPGTVDDCIYEPDEEDCCFCCEDEVNANRMKSRIQFKYPPEIPMSPSDTSRSTPAVRRSQSQINSPEREVPVPVRQQGGRTIDLPDDTSSDEEGNRPRARAVRDRRSSATLSGSSSRFSQSSSASGVNVSNSSFLGQLVSFVREHMLELGALIICVIILVAIFFYTKDYRTNAQMADAEEYAKPALTKYGKPVM